MRIISKYKDYYDYLQGIRGIDNKIVLDRRSDDGDLRIGKGEVLHFHICGMKYDVIWGKNGKFYATPEAKERVLKAHFEKSSMSKYYSWDEWKKRVRSTSWERFTYKDADGEHNDCNLKPIPSNINDKYDCPIVLTGNTWTERHQKFPYLENYGIPAVIPAEQMWDMLYNWVSSRIEKPIVDTRTDVQKVESAGFDKITSFRNM